MIYLLYGDDTYLSWQKLQQIKAKYTNTSKGDTDLITLDGASLTAEQFADQTQTRPFLAKSRLVVVRNLLKEGSKEVQEKVVGLLAKVPTSTVLFFYEAGRPDQRGKLFQALNQPKQAQVFEPLVGPKLAQYAVNAAAAEKLALSMPLATRLTAIIGPDLWRLHQELTKLSLFKKPNQPTVTEADLEALVAGLPSARVFDLTDALGQRQSAKAARLVNQLATNENDLGLLAMVAGHYRNLLLVADGLQRQSPKSQLAGVMKIHPFAFDKAYAQARAYSYTELVNIYRYLYQLDLAAKQSLITPLTGLIVLAGALAEKPVTLPTLVEE